MAIMHWACKNIMFQCSSHVDPSILML
jgi:hypothetical protein